MKFHLEAVENGVVAAGGDVQDKSTNYICTGWEHTSTFTPG
jgi:hypothetical protein